MALISTLDETQIEDIVKPVYEKLKKQGGKVPEWAMAMAHCPNILKEFVELFSAVMGKGKIEQYLKWKIAYVVSQTLKCSFCIDVTEKMLGRLGATREVIEKIKNIKGLSEEEKKVLELIKDVTLNGYLDNPELFKELKKEFSEPQIVEIISVVGLFNYINRFNNLLAILPE